MREDLNDIGGTVRHPAMRDTAGIGYVIVPNDMDYYEYINNCIRNSMITILTDRGELIKNVLVARNIWQDIDFPKGKDQKGSALVWLNIPNKNKPVVLLVLNKTDDLNKSTELNSFEFSKQSLMASCSMTGNGEEGVINITTEGGSQMGSKINFKVTNDSELGEFNVYVQGDILFEAENNFEVRIKNKFNFQIIDEVDEEKQTNISYELRKGFTYLDEFGNSITISEKGFEVIDVNKNRITSDVNGIEAVVDDNKLSVKKGVAGILYKKKYIKIDDSGITIDSLNDDVQINAGNNVIQMTNSGINIDSSGKPVYLNGSNEVLYSKIPGLTAIADVSQIGVSKKVKVG